MSVLDDDKTYIVQHVNDHEIITRNGRQSLNLNIKWQGYITEDWNSINTTLQDNIIVQQYLKDNNLERFGRPKKRAAAVAVVAAATPPARKRVKFSNEELSPGHHYGTRGKTQSHVQESYADSESDSSTSSDFEYDSDDSEEGEQEDQDQDEDEELMDQAN